ncbi:type VII secretion protein EccB [Antrihabitans sp. YC2-6]|uniref:type VII secretion protein EccB n=1 Tax=Antrihabitans sp. YC2-6 TaxID=2799498 RepID=UPI0018F6E837|nr:type VII secretion protein EccB [Antrihabitans sp. YC2-6]MBJ8347469.1 type VII secretion protein EccB [Antrihabitans sp. YC2-6]
MPAQPTTKWQVSGYRFLVRRMEHALVRRDVRMLHDPMRSQSRALMVGAIIAILALAACGILALIRPQDKIGDNKIVVGKDSGAMFVVIGDTLHPVMNLASARLITGAAAKPAIVKESEIEKRSRGSLVGIPGAPSALPYDSAGSGRAWTVCDSIAIDGSLAITTSVIVGEPERGEGISELGAGRALLVRSGDGTTYLVYDGKRAQIDTNNRALVAALALEGRTPRPISAGLLNAIPAAPAITPPAIAGARTRPSYDMQGQLVGSVVQSTRGESAEYYVLLTDGIQRVSSATMELIRFDDSVSAEIARVPPDLVADAPHVNTLPVATYPETVPAPLETGDNPVSCLTWQPVSGAESNRSAALADVTVTAGRALPISGSAKEVRLAQADGSGDKADAVYLHPGTGAYVQTTGIQPDSQRKDSSFFVADTGVRYGIVDADAAKALGFEGAAEPAPWQIVSLLAPGSPLGRREALVAYDGAIPESPAAVDGVVPAGN